MRQFFTKVCFVLTILSLVVFLITFVVSMLSGGNSCGFICLVSFLAIWIFGILELTLLFLQPNDIEQEKTPYNGWHYCPPSLNPCEECSWEIYCLKKEVEKRDGYFFKCDRYKCKYFSWD